MKTPIADTPAPGAGEFYDTLEALVASLARVEATQADLAATVGPAALKFQLDSIDAVLKDMRDSLQQQADFGTVVREHASVITEAVGVMHSQGADVLRGVALLVQRSDQHPQSSRSSWTTRLVPWVSGALGGMVLMGAVWWVWPGNALAGLAVHLDRALVRSYGQLPKPAQESIADAYKQAGFQSPATRQKGGL